MRVKDAAEARQWLAETLHVSRETQQKLDAYVGHLRAANKQQNLIAASTAGDAIWVRHVADSAQLLLHAADAEGPWLDLGSGPGLPGLVVALCDPARHVTLVESRRLRCAFLRECISALGVEPRVRVIESPLARVSTERFGVISARAFAPLPRLLTDAARFAGPGTRWLLPKGRSAQNELSSAPAAWQRLFHVEPSLTDAEAAILCGTGVPLGKAGRN